MKLEKGGLQLLDTYFLIVPFVRWKVMDIKKHKMLRLACVLISWSNTLYFSRSLPEKYIGYSSLIRSFAIYYMTSLGHDKDYHIGFAPGVYLFKFSVRI